MRRIVEFVATAAIVLNALTLVPAGAGASTKKVAHDPGPGANLTVTYAPNGGTGVPSDTTKYAANATVTIKTSPVPSKANCSFTGYVLSTTAPEPHTPTPPNTYAYSSGTFTPANFKITANSTLTAQFDCTQHFTVTYNGNGGGLVPTDSTSYADDSTVTILATPIPTKAGCTFAGYLGSFDDDNDSNDGSDQGPYGANTFISYAGGQFTPANFKIDENVTLTAQWGCYTVTYGGGNPVDPNFYSSGDKVTVLGPPPATGCPFLGYNLTVSGGSGGSGSGGTGGWSGGPQPPRPHASDGDSNDNDGDADDNGQVVTISYAGGKFTPATFVLTGNTTLTPVYACFTVTYNANGGSNAPVDSNNYAPNAKVTVAPGTGMTAPPAKCFAGWATSNNALTPSYAAGTNFTITANTTLYAVWASCFTVTYNANGGANPPVDAKNPYGSGALVSVLGAGAMTAPGANYRFAGWATTANATSAKYQPGATFTITGNTTLYAVWTICVTAKYTVTYDPNGGSGTPVDPNTYSSGATVTVLASPIPTKTGCTFTGYLGNFDDDNDANDGSDQGPYGANTFFSSAGGHFSPANFKITQNVILTAQWSCAAVTYTVTYNANGGSGAPTDPRSPYTAGSSVTVLGKGAMSAPAGCSFAGWSTSTTATSATYVAGNTFTISANTTLYAVWNPCTTYTVTYNANGGSGAPTDSNNPYAAGTTVTVAAGSGMTPPAGCSFAGWSTSPTATSATYVAGNTFTISANTTLYAVWNPCTTYTVTYNANGGSGAPVDASSPYVPGATVTVLAKGSMTAPTGCTFAGWATTANAATPSYVAGSTFQINADVTFYAVWNPCAKYTVTYDANGGTGAPVDGLSPYSAGATVTVLSGSGMTPPAGCTFAGWTNGVGTTFAAGSTFTINANTIFYAVWTPCSTYSVTYNANGGANPPVDPSSPYVPNATVTVLAKGGMTGPTGCTFAGWSTSSTATSPTYVAGNTLSITADTTLYAVWSPCSKYTVSYNANGGTGAPSDPNSPYTAGATVTVLPGTGLTAPAGCTFAGWSTGTGTTYAPGSQFTITANTTLYAVWNPCITFSVSYDANGGSGAPTDGFSPYAPGSTVTVLNNLGMTGPAGCSFAGWATNSSASAANYIAGDTFTITASTTLYAVWTPCATYSVTYNANGGSGAPTDGASPYIPGSTVTVLSGSGLTPPPGCTFGGWGTTSNATFQPGDTFSIAGNVTLYALWVNCATFTVTYNANGGSNPPTDGNVYALGATVSVLSNLGMTGPAGCTFAGWSTSPSAQVSNYSPASTFAISSSTTLYAVWHPCSTYNITYNPNGGSGSVTDPTSYSPGSNATVLDGSGLTPPTGCSFDGWTTNGITIYDPSQSITVTGNVTLYALWSPCITYSVTYNANGGSGAPVDGLNPYVPGASVTALSGLGMTGPAGCTFAGWSTDSSAAVPTYVAGAVFSISASLTLYAVWNPCTTYTVTYNANGGSGAPSDPNSPYVPGSTVTVLSGSSLVAPSGCTFGGWTSTGATTYQPQAQFTINSNVTLYAIWNDCITYTVLYNANGGSGAPTDQAGPYVPGATVTVLPGFAMTAPNGCSFSGWSTDANAQVGTLAGGSTFTISGNTTLFAIWHPCVTYGVHYNLNGGTGTTPTDNNTYTPGSQVSAKSASGITAPAGCTFAGWSIDGSTVIGGNTLFTLNGNVTLYAVWDPCVTYTVTYDANGGSGAPTDPFGPYAPGATVTVLSNLGMTGPTGCTFAGWSTNSSAAVPTYVAGDTFLASASVTLYAVWNPCAKYTVTYNANGGTGSVVDPTSPYTPGSTVTVLSGSGLTAPTGCSFGGWSTSAQTTYAADATFTINSNVTLYAIWTNCVTYTVTYNANGGSGAPTDPFGPYVPGATVTVLSNLGMTAPNGCSFSGWSTDANAQVGTLAGGSTFPISGNTTLFAIWHPCVTYTVHYNLDGGTGTTPIDSNTYTPGSQVTAKPVAGITPPAGCTFAGWSIDGSTVIGGNTLFALNGNVTLNAVWDPCVTYTVTYNANGGSGAPVDNLNPYVPGSSVTVLSDLGMTGPTGCTFAGWSTDPNATTATYTAAGTFTISASLTLYAVWHPCSKYTVTYNANGGTGSVVDPTSPYTPGSTVTVLSGSGLTAPTGCSFGGWSTNAETTYAANATFTINSNVTLYAIWTNCVTYTVTYNANGGSGAPTDGFNPYVPGASATVLSNLGMSGPVGCTFAGWSTDSNALSATYHAGDALTVNSNVTLYAVWHPCSTYHVTYNGNGGTGTPPTDGTPYTPGQNATVLPATSLTAPAGCSFGGWTANGTTVYNPADLLAVNGNVTLYALWVGCTNVFVTYNANGGTGAPTDSTVYVAGATVTVLSNLGMTAPAGCSFAGWSTDQNAVTATYLATNTFTIQQNTTLYAVWHPCSTYHVTYNANGGSGAPTDSTNYTPGQTATVKPGSGMVPPTGCTFAGWKSNANTTYQPTGQFSVNGNVTLFAVWSCTQYTVTYNANGGSGAPTDANSPYYSGSTVVVLNGLGLTVPPSCSFGGWSTDKNATLGSYTGGETFTITSNVTLYAVWVSCKIYTVTYNANGGSNPPSDVGGPYAKGASVNVLGQGLMTGPNGCSFAGWSTNQNASSATYVGGSSFTVQGDTTLFAIWHPCVTYTVSFNPSGGFNPPANEGPFQPGDNVPVPPQGGMTGPTGCSFLGWSTNPGATTAQYVAPATFPAAANLTLYAVWGDCARYTVTYDANGGLNPPTDSTVYHAGSTFTVKDAGAMTSGGCTFAGWSTSSTATSSNYTPGGNYTINSNVTLYAVWKNCVTLTVVIHGGNARNCGSVALHGHVGTHSIPCGNGNKSVTVAKVGTIANVYVPSQPNFETVWSIRDPHTHRLMPLNCHGSHCQIPINQSEYVVVAYVSVPIFLFNTDVYKTWLPLTAHQKAILLGQLEQFVGDGVKTVYVRGYADPRSSVAYNEVLSYHRSRQVVLSYLNPLVRRLHLHITFKLAPMGETTKFQSFQADRSVRLSAA